MQKPPDSRPETDPPVLNGALVERVDALTAWMDEMETRVHATVAVTGDRKTAKELRRAIEALSKRDPKFEERLTNKVDVVADRLETLARTVSTTAATLAAKDGELAGIRRELGEGHTRVETVIAELRRAVEGVGLEEHGRAPASPSEPAALRKGEVRRLDGLSGKVDALAQRLDMFGTTLATTAAGLAGREGDIAALRRRLDDDNARIEAAVSDLRRAVDPTPLAELRLGVKELSDEASAFKRTSQRRHDGVSAKVESVTDRLESVATTVAATAADLSVRESEIVALRAAFDDESARVDSLLSKLHRATSALSDQLPNVDGFAERGAVDELRAKIDNLDGQLGSLDAIVTATSTGQADRALEIARLSKRFTDGSSKVEGLVRELQSALESMPEPGRDPELESRVDELAEHVDAIKVELERLGTASSEQVAEGTSRAGVLERLLAELAERLDGVERDRSAAAAEVARVSAAWAEEREWVRRQLEELPPAPAGAPHTLEGVSPQIDELISRLDAMERDRVKVSAEVAGAYELLHAERESLQTQLDELAARLAKPVASVAGDASDPLLAELADKLDSVERNEAAVASEVAHAAAFWASSLGSIERRLDKVEAARSDGLPHLDAGSELAPRLEAIERTGAAATAEIARLAEARAADRLSLEARLDEVATQLQEAERGGRGAARPSSEDEVAQLRVLVDGLRMRLASSERGLAALAGSHEFVARLDDVTARLDLMERTGDIVVASSLPVPGDGRFRLELRGLELRMEHAEAAARENREAVLTQLERLASRIEWRLQRLESDQTGPSYDHAAAADARVVPIRSNEL